MKAYELIPDEQLRTLIGEFLDWSGGDTPEHNIWESSDEEDEDIPQIRYFVDGRDEKEYELFEDWHDEIVEPVFMEKLKNIVRELQAGWQSPTYPLEK